jgi:hypothetical protein
MTEPECFEVGDLIAVERRRPTRILRTGEVIAVHGDPRHPHYSVRWEDGHETLYYPPDDRALHDALSFDDQTITRRVVGRDGTART